MMKRIGFCFLGILSSVLLLSMFVTFDVMLGRLGLFGTDNVNDSVWRFDWFYQPAIVVVISLGVSLLDGTKTNFMLAVIAVLPFLFLNINASSYSARSIMFTGFYLAIAGAVAWLTPRRRLSVST